MAVSAAVVALVIVTRVTSDANGGLKPYGLAETLPGMTASFGTGARVVEIIVGSSGIYYQVIGADRRLHIRDYTIVQSEIEAGTSGYNRRTTNFIRTATPSELRGAVLTLGQLDSGVVDGLYRQVGFPRQGSSATLTGRSWFLESGAEPEHRFLASYDGRGLQRTDAVTPSAPGSLQATTPARPSTASSPSASSTTHSYRFTTTISSGSPKPNKLDRDTRRLLNCITSAQGDLDKIAACQRKFTP